MLGGMLAGHDECTGDIVEERLATSGGRQSSGRVGRREVLRPRLSHRALGCIAVESSHMPGVAAACLVHGNARHAQSPSSPPPGATSQS